MAQINPRTFADAKQLADNVYELILTNWGNTGKAKDPNNGSISYPPVKNIPSTQAPGVLPEGAIPLAGLPPAVDFLLPPIPSLYGIAIAPRSDVDKCILTFPSLPQISAENTTTPFDGSVWDVFTEKSINLSQGFVNYGGYLDTEQFLSVGAPLIGQLPGPIVIRALSEHYFTDSQFAQDPTGTDTYGTALNNLDNTTGPGFFWTPRLRLLLYLTAKTVLPPLKRAPFSTSGSLLALYPNFDIPPFVVPVHGRRHVSIAVRNTEAFAIDFIVAGTWESNNNSGSSAFANLEEFYYSTTNIPAGTSAVIHVDQPPAPFMNLYAANGGLGGLDFKLLAVD
jgi:hypothetical protein